MGEGRGFVTCHLLRLSLGREGDQYKAAGACALHLTRSACLSRFCPLLTPLTTTMTLGIQAPFFLLLLLVPVLTGERHKVRRGCSALVVFPAFLWVLFPGRWHPKRQKLQTGGLICARTKERGYGQAEKRRPPRRVGTRDRQIS